VEISMTRRFLRAALTAVLIAVPLLTGAPAGAHHSFAVEFDASKSGHVEGVVKEVWFRAPHVRYYVTVVRDGKDETWDVHTLSPTTLRRAGLSQPSVAVGDRIAVDGYLARDGNKKLYATRITTADGKVHQLSQDPTPAERP
jgi:hypothetical protein